MTHATPRPVDPMLCATGKGMQGHANAFLNTLVTHMWLVGLSVWSILTAPPTKHARGTSASTHALELVASMQSARCEATAQLAPASPTTSETRSLHVD